MSGPANTESALSINADKLIEQIEAIRTVFDSLEVGVRKKYMGAAVNAAIKPLFATFQSLIPVGPTGNLSRSAVKVIRKYEHTAVGIIGYAMSHSNDEKAKGWGQGFIEYGTDERPVSGSVASSYKKRGGFTIETAEDGGVITSNPKYPTSFFKRAKAGEQVVLARSPKGGIRGVSPLAQTWQQGGVAAGNTLVREMKAAMEKAIDEQIRRARRLGR